MLNTANKQQYLKTKISTASKEQLVLMLYDGALRFSEQAKEAMKKNEIENYHNFLIRTQAIIMELIYSLDREKGGEIAENLLGLYAYCFSCLIKANVEKDIASIEQIQNVISGLREGWIVAMNSPELSKPTEDHTEVNIQSNNLATTESSPTTLQEKPQTTLVTAPKKSPIGYAMGKTATLSINNNTNTIKFSNNPYIKPAIASQI